MSFTKEFRQFVARGNVVDLAVGVIIGGAFGKIVSSLVQDIFTPVLGVLLGKVNIAHLKATIGEGLTENPVVIQYGNFLQSTLDFVIVALALFLVIKLINRFHHEEEQAPIPATPSREEVLLTEIRDLLKR